MLQLRFDANFEMFSLRKKAVFGAVFWWGFNRGFCFCGRRWSVVRKKKKKRKRAPFSFPLFLCVSVAAEVEIFVRWS